MSKTAYPVEGGILTKQPKKEKMNLENIEIEKARMSDIKPSNINTTIYQPHHEDRIVKLANNIKKNGLMEPLIVTRDGFIVSGHTRYAAMKYLNRTFVNVRRLNINSDHPEIPGLIIAANDQRVKTPEERVNELIAGADSTGYRFRLKEVYARDTGLEAIQGGMNERKKLTDNYSEMVLAIQEVLSENKDYLPMTLRGIHYQLLEKRPIVSKLKATREGEDAARYDNNQASYNALSKIATKMRVEGYIPYQDIRDDGRKLTVYRGYQNSGSYIEEQARNLFRTYFRDNMQTQPFYIAIVCEKETVSNVLDDISLEWGVPVVYTKGGSSIDIRYRLIRDNEKNGSKPMRILFLSDMDPAGYRIQDTFVGSFASDFGRTDVEAYRVGLTKEQIGKYNLFSDMDAKKTDTNYKKFVERTGMTKAYELDALKPGILKREVTDALHSIIDQDLYNQQVSNGESELRKLEGVRSAVLEYLGQAGIL